MVKEIAIQTKLFFVNRRKIKNLNVFELFINYKIPKKKNGETIIVITEFGKSCQKQTGLFEMNANTLKIKQSLKKKTM